MKIFIYSLFLFFPFFSFASITTTPSSPFYFDEFVTFTCSNPSYNASIYFENQWDGSPIGLACGDEYYFQSEYFVPDTMTVIECDPSLSLGLCDFSDPDRATAIQNAIDDLGYVSQQDFVLSSVPQNESISFSNGDIASSTCETDLGVTSCEYHYYPNSTPVTPFNMFLYFCTFLLSFYSTVYLIKKLT